jgi:FAD/FMN-containing dehydrogenase
MSDVAFGRDNAFSSRLRSAVRGTVLVKSEAGYDEARKIYNAMVDRRPAVIVRCAGYADVLRAVQFAREQNLLVAVRGGGHNVAGNALCDDGLVIDLSRMRAVHVDPIQRIARAQGGATWGDYDCETQAFGLASTGGAVSTTGIAGLTLGGGLGWLMRKHGLACDNLLSVDVVTAEGELIRASADEHPICSGAFVAAVAILGLSRRSSIACTRSARCSAD